MQHTTRAIPARTLPVISVAGLQSPDPQARAAVGRALHAACSETGFFYCIDHGVKPELIAAVFAQSRQFFALPMADRLAVHKNRSPCNRGYEPLRDQTLEPGTPPDVKEGFYSGPEKPLDDPAVRAGRFNQGPNQWPAALPDFRAVMSEYSTVMTRLAETLMRGIALSLGLAEDYFAAFCHDPLTTLRLLHYPPQPARPLPGEKGAGAHTDFGGLTLLLQDDSGGLQVRAADGTWLDAAPIPGSFVVNLGDMIARWTNNRYRSTLHRVINTSGRERYSVPFFHTGNPDQVIACLPGCVPEGEAPLWPPVTVEDHLRAMYARTYGR
ncbi:isopenicillin N synthase family oxygenase [Komagataeibacter rhaeticus]|uniref:2-oxoglutarate-dependent ethylene/succinate-forming enzyme n=3 Tax=Komagataeibacter rhaeticus TaxID=215221 RepID=A0A858JMR5_9PROT|nr:isopenicillin N synthase family oxygenase [Komagataeibacter rhaeticus]QIP36994.1 isopenicillin N synthase family oxygenase [Komagataeibacter rhaeticus]QOC48148.1 isopenicillin N synthase family oxygenase [Komagataeibacter rhaeticus]